MRRQQLFTCKYCGFSSTKKAKIATCEARGNKHQFLPGTAVEFQAQRYGYPGWLPGDIHDIEFTEVTHEPGYSVALPDDVKEKIHQSPDTMSIGRFSENEIRKRVIDVPANLGAVMKKDLAGYQQVLAYFLELEHGLMGFFPALISQTGEPVVCLDEILISQVKDFLPPRRYKQGQFQMLAKIHDHYGFDINSGEGEAAKPLHILSFSEFRRLSQQSDSFKWAPGLVGDDMSQKEFVETLDLAARQNK